MFIMSPIHRGSHIPYIPCPSSFRRQMLSRDSVTCTTIPTARTVQRLYFTVSHWSVASLKCPGVFAATTKVRKTMALMLRKEIYLRAVTCPDISGSQQTRFLYTSWKLEKRTSNDQFPALFDHHAPARGWNITVVELWNGTDVPKHQSLAKVLTLQHSLSQLTLQPPVIKRVRGRTTGGGLDGKIILGIVRFYVWLPEGITCSRSTTFIILISLYPTVAPYKMIGFFNLVELNPPFYHRQSQFSCLITRFLSLLFFVKSIFSPILAA